MSSDSYASIEKLLLRAKHLLAQKYLRAPQVIACAPGRVNLIGEHVDYNGGFVFPMALPMVTLIAGYSNGTNTCNVSTDFTSAAGDPQDVSFPVPSESVKLEAGTPKWANYVKGVVANFHSNVHGFDCVIVSSVPVGAGLSSSAALEVAMYTFLEKLMQNDAPDLKQKALACQKAEHQYAHVPCGIMDQFISAMGKEGHALLIDCKSLESELVPLDDPTISILITDSSVKHQLSGSEYPQRKAQCEAAAKVLGVELLRDATMLDLESKKDLLDGETFRRASHVIGEIERTRRAAELLKAGCYVEVGKLMTESHESLRDLYNVSCTEIDILVSAACAAKGVYGSRITGGGFGGCTVTLVNKADVEEVIGEMRKSCENCGIQPKFYVCTPKDGARALPAA